MLKAPNCGQPINLDNSIENKVHTMGAHGMISQFLNMKANYHDRLKTVAGGDMHADRYFCSDDCAYVFELNILKALVKAIEKDGNKDGYVILFQGLRRDPVDNDALNKGCSFGRPTLIATAYTTGSDGMVHYTKIPFDEHDDENVAHKTVEAFEHPGNGTGATGMAPKDDPAETSKVVERTASELFDTDFNIMKTIPLGSIHHWQR